MGAGSYGFTGKEEDVEVGLVYFGMRFLSPQLGRWVSADPLAVHVPGESSSSDERGEQQIADANVYAYVCGNVLAAVDELGLFPTKDLATNIGRWKEAFDRKPVVKGKVYDRGGTSNGNAAADTLKKYGETTGWFIWQKPTGKNIWMSGRTERHATAENVRFVYTEKGGWIDMAHFMFYAGRARMHKEMLERELGDPGSSLSRANKVAPVSPGELAKSMAMKEGYRQEMFDSVSSKYSYEDLPSDNYGADFGANHFDPTSKKTLSEQVESYVKMLKPTRPDAAPNWNHVPSGDPMSMPPEPPRNETVQPMFTRP